MEQREILVKSSLDQTLQPSLFYATQSTEKRPLLVGLHTWSCNRFNQINNMLPLAEKYDFNLLLPEFRGGNLVNNQNRTLACGSEFAKQDIKDAIDYVIEHENVDADNIFLLGLSGGGHMALLIAGMIPEYFKAIGSYVPITDLKKWADYNEQYRPHILACCSDSEEEMVKRSPMTYIDTIAKANLKIFHGKRDGIVPVMHSIELYNKLMEKHPKARVYLDIFDGAHQIDMKTAEYWLISQYKKTAKTAITG